MKLLREGEYTHRFIPKQHGQAPRCQLYQSCWEHLEESRQPGQVTEQRSIPHDTIDRISPRGTEIVRGEKFVILSKAVLADDVHSDSHICNT